METTTQNQPPLSEEVQDALEAFKARFNNMPHLRIFTNITWEEVKAALTSNPAAQDAIARLENAGHEPAAFAKEAFGDFIYIATCASTAPGNYETRAAAQVEADRLGLPIIPYDLHRILDIRMHTTENTGHWITDRPDMLSYDREVYAFSTDGRGHNICNTEFSSTPNGPIGLRVVLRVPLTNQRRTHSTS